MFVVQMPCRLGKKWLKWKIPFISAEQKITWDVPLKATTTETFN